MFAAARSESRNAVNTWIEMLCYLTFWRASILLKRLTLSLSLSFSVSHSFKFCFSPPDCVWTRFMRSVPLLFGRKYFALNHNKRFDSRHSCRSPKSSLFSLNSVNVFYRFKCMEIGIWNAFTNPRCPLRHALMSRTICKFDAGTTSSSGRKNMQWDQCKRLPFDRWIAK